jgi:hypothetical protein
MQEFCASRTSDDHVDHKPFVKLQPAGYNLVSIEFNRGDILVHLCNPQTDSLGHLLFSGLKMPLKTDQVGAQPLAVKSPNRPTASAWHLLLAAVAGISGLASARTARAGENVIVPDGRTGTLVQAHGSQTDISTFDPCG